MDVRGNFSLRVFLLISRWFYLLFHVKLYCLVFQSKRFSVTHLRLKEAGFINFRLRSYRGFHVRYRPVQSSRVGEHTLQIMEILIDIHYINRLISVIHGICDYINLLTGFCEELYSNFLLFVPRFVLIQQVLT